VHNILSRERGFSAPARVLVCLFTLIAWQALRANDEWVDPNNPDRQLEIATAQNNLGSAKAAIEAGADVNKVHADNVWSPLTDAIEQKKMPFVKLLVDYGADVNKADMNLTPLMSAAEVGANDIFEFLLQCGADFKVRSSAKENAFIVAARCYQAGTLEYIATRHPEIMRDGNSLNEALLAAAGSGASQSVRELLKLGANVNTRNASEATPLISACMWGYAIVARILLDHGADVNAQDNWGFTALHMAANGGHVKTIRALLAAGASRSTVDRADKETPAQTARRNGYKEAAKLLEGHPSIVKSTHSH
jgi:uncharacterized protein